MIKRHRHQRGFTLIETLLVLIIVVVLVLVGYSVYRHAHKPGTLNVSATAISKNSATTIISGFQSSIEKNFHTVSSLECNAMSATECTNYPASTVSIMGNNTFTPPRKISGTSFFVMPYLSGNYAIDINTQNNKSTENVLSFITKDIDANNFSYSTSMLSSVSEPTYGSAKTYVTFYSASSLCEVDTNNITSSSGQYIGGDILLSCAPISVYAPTASELEPIFNAYLAARPQFSNPQSTGKWLRLQPDDTSAYPLAYIFNSKTPGYKIGIVDILQITTNSYDQIAYFYETNGNWQLVNDNESNYAIDCNVSFPDSDAHLAFIGQECIDQNNNNSTIK
ncbi:MAG: prepilin-type N-terminal cleavage/methylation domain-containing protein [Candidatus Saccharibacteria bacterium]